MTASPTSIDLTGQRKAAVFLLGLGDAASAEVFRLLTPAEVQIVTAEIASTPAVAPDEIVSVFREFEAKTPDARLFARGGAESAKRLVEQAFGAESARKMLPPAGESAAAGGGEQLFESADPQQLAGLLRNENPQMTAVLLSNLPPKTAVELLASLPEALQQQALLRMARLDRVSPEAFQNVAEAIGQKLRSSRRMDRPDGVRAAAALLKQSPAALADALLAAVGEHAPELAAELRDRMFSFEDIVSIGAESIRALVGRVDRKILTLALKGAPGALRAHITAQLSQRAAEMLGEDMEALGPVRVRDVKAAQAEIVATIRKLQDEGAVSVGGDDYVE